MSATNRGSKRVASDFYATPHVCIEKFLQHYGPLTGDILEPSAGNGHIVEIVKKSGNNSITALEKRQEERETLQKIADQVVIGDFLNYDTQQKFQYIVGNPPYSMAQEFLEKCFELAGDDTVVIMLLRTNFLESKKRYEFWQKHPVSKLYVLSQRPSFTGKGTDATSYSWFVWDKTGKQEIHVI